MADIIHAAFKSMKTVSLEGGFVWERRRANEAKSVVHLPDLKPDYSSPVWRKSGKCSSRSNLRDFSVIFHKLDRMPMGLMSLIDLTTVLLTLLKRAILH